MKTCILLFFTLIMANVNLVNGDNELSKNLGNRFSQNGLGVILGAFGDHFGRLQK